MIEPSSPALQRGTIAAVSSISLPADVDPVEGMLERAIAIPTAPALPNTLIRKLTGQPKAILRVQAHAPHGAQHGLVRIRRASPARSSTRDPRTTDLGCSTPGSAAASRSEVVGCDLLGAVIQEAVHHMDVDVSKPLMLEGLWDSANDREPQFPPKRNGVRIRAHDEVELHGYITSVSGLGEAMLAKRFANSYALRRRIDHEGGVCNMRAEVSLIGPELVHAKNE
jgi:hypothetical protein